jgi:hypothetical protein
VRVLLPGGYASSGERRYPVLYLLHGSVDDYRSWTDKGDAEHLTAGLPMIVVMPDAGSGGFYSDWYNNGAGGPPEWETYHVRELIPWIDAHYRTIASRAGRATAGLSMGGFGAMTYPSRHSDLFVAAASFSGAVNTNDFQPTGKPDESSFETFTAIEPTYDVYGWHVAIDRPALEFSRLEGASRHGFRVAGSGSATVVTASLFRPDATYPVTIAGHEGRATADAQGRLHFGLTLGPGNPAQQYTPAAEALGTQVFRTSVQIGAASPLAGPMPPAARSRPPRHARHHRRHHRRHRHRRDRR